MKSDQARPQTRAYDLKRDARSLRTRADRPDLVASGEDHLGRRVRALFGANWRTRLMRLTPGSVLAVRGRVETNSSSALTLTDATLIENE